MWDEQTASPSVVSLPVPHHACPLPEHPEGCSSVRRVPLPLGEEGRGWDVGGSPRGGPECRADAGAVLFARSDMQRSLGLFLFILLALAGRAAAAQVVYVTEWKSEADTVVYVTEWKSEADVVVYVTDWKSEATPGSGIWYYTEWTSEADVTVYLTEWASEADVVVYFTEWKSEAGPK